VHSGVTADPDELAFAPDESELVRISTSDVPVAVKRRDILGLATSAMFAHAWREWSRYRRFGLPHARGPNAERPVLIRVIEVLEQEFEDYQACEMERNRGRR